MLRPTLEPRKPESATYAVGYDRLHGNELSLFEKREAKLTWMTPYYQPPSQPLLVNHLDRVPIRMSDKMVKIRSEETMSFGKRRFMEPRRMQTEFAEKIQQMLQRQREEEERTKGVFKRRRWWHRANDTEMRDPIKSIRFNNLRVSPEELLNTKDIVHLQLTGCRVGDAACDWISAFIQQSYTLKRINLQGNNITEEGVKALFMGFRHTRTLIDIDLSLNPIGDAGVVSLCNALVENCRVNKVYRLNLGTCKLTSDSGYHLARVVREMRSLQMLLLWRNQLGVPSAHTRTGASMILEELPGSTHLRVLDLTANHLRDQDLAAHCASLESTLRRTRLQDIEKKQRVLRLKELRDKIEEKRRDAVWDDEKMEVNRLECAAEQERARIHQFMIMENRSRTKEQREDDALRDDIMRHTGGLELITPIRRLRLVINGNHSILPSTMQRLRMYYDISVMQNPALWVQLPRRHQLLINPRRELGEPYETRDHNAYDEHNIFRWEDDPPYDPESDYRRRRAIYEYREAERIRKLNSKPAEFKKFQVNVHGEGGEGKIAVGGIGVASGVNARLRETTTDEKANYSPERGGLMNPGDVKGTHTKIVVDKPPILVDEDDDRNEVIQVKRSKDKNGNVVVRVDGDIKEDDRAKIEAEARSLPVGQHQMTVNSARVSIDEAPWGAEGEQYQQLLPGRRRKGSSSFDQGGQESEIVKDAEELEREEAAELAERVSKKLTSRLQEVRQHIAKRRSTVGGNTLKFQPTPEGVSTPCGSQAWENSADGGYVPATPREVLDSAPEAKEGTPIAMVMEHIKGIYEAWDDIRRWGEIGSPSDEELAKLDAAKHRSAEKKKLFAEALEASLEEAEGGAPIVIAGDQGDVAATFLEDLIKETDAPPYNTTLFKTFLRAVSLPYSTLIDERGWASMAACDGSEVYLPLLLGVAEEFDLLEVICGCFFNPLTRIPLSLILLDVPNLNWGLVSEEQLQPIAQEFFEDICSEKKALTREVREGKLELVQKLLDHPVIKIQLEHEAADFHTCVSRALYEGDKPLLNLFFSEKNKATHIHNINMVKSDNMTPLFLAVLGNHVSAVAALLESFPGDQLDINWKNSEGLTALDMAVTFERDVDIIELLQGRGAVQSKQQEIAEVEVSNGQMKIKGGVKKVGIRRKQ